MAFENLRRQRELDDDGELRLLSVVVYSGRERWKGPGGTARVTVDRDGEILRSQPYVLLDTGQAAQDDLPADNIVAAVCHLDNARSAKDAMRCAESLARRLSESLEAAERDIVLEGAVRLAPDQAAERFGRPVNGGCGRVSERIAEQGGWHVATRTERSGVDSGLDA